MHSSLMLSYRQAKILIDCGVDWKLRLSELKPHAIVITHAHPDHAGGLKDGASCPVYATEEAWQTMRRYAVKDKEVIECKRPLNILGIIFEAFRVEHSIRAPAMGYRITAGNTILFYAPDLVYIHDRQVALSQVLLYVGDGASVTRPIVRKRDNVLFGHAPIRTQLTWCQKEGVPRAVFTHCGSQIVCADEGEILKRVKAFGTERSVDAEIAHDGMILALG